MNDIIMSWPWYDRVIAGGLIAVLLLGPFYVVQRLDRIIKLLEAIANRER